MAGNERRFGALTFCRLLRVLLLSGGHRIPIFKKSRAPVQEADKSETVHTPAIGSTPIKSILALVPTDIADEFVHDNDDWDDIPDIDDDFDDSRFPTTLIKSSNPTRPDNSGDYLFDEMAPDIRLEIVEEEGFSYYAGYLGKGNEDLTKTLSEGQSLPTSKLADFDLFDASEWIDARNKAYTGK